MDKSKEKPTAQASIQEAYGNRLRVRVCGVLKQNGKVLLIKHLGLGDLGYWWAPPGGGVEFGEHIEDALKREFLEEVALVIEVGQFLELRETIKLPLHAIELFYEVRKIAGDLAIGRDPETEVQIMSELAWFSVADLAQLPRQAYHPVLTKLMT